MKQSLTFNILVLLIGCCIMLVGILNFNNQASQIILSCFLIIIGLIMAVISIISIAKMRFEKRK